MIASMTGYARLTEDNPWGSLTWEMRSVNHRYLEINLRLPEIMRALEADLRDAISQKMKRGKVDAYLKFVPGEEVPFEFELNQGLLSRLSNAAQQVQQTMSDSQVAVTDVLNWPGMLLKKETKADAIQKTGVNLLQQTLDELVATRCREGSGLHEFMEARIADIQMHVAMIKEKLPAILQAERERVIKKINELKLTLDQDRLEQEMVWLAQKIDVAEEIQRLQSHLTEVQRVLKKGGVIGRRLDFLMQELNREANTLTSKSISADVTQKVVEIKVSIEQMREQVQNIE